MTKDQEIDDDVVGTLHWKACANCRRFNITYDSVYHYCIDINDGHCKQYAKKPSIWKRLFALIRQRGIKWR